MRDIDPELTYLGKSREEDLLGTPLPREPRPLRVHGGGGGSGSAWKNMLIGADNLPALKRLLEMKSEGTLASADGTPGARLVYIDPPFSTNLTFRTRGRRKAFDDKVTGAEFLEFLRKRLVLLRELLAEDGSIFVHLDWKAAHSVKVMMDEVFGAGSFLNDIVWHYGGRGAKATSNQFSRNHDNILWYKKNARCVFNRVYVERRIRKGEEGFRRDADGRWFKTSPRGDYTDASVAALEKEGRVHRTRSGKVRIKYFVEEDGDYLLESKPVGDVWDDIPDAMHIPRDEKTGYPTQKPEALLARIIAASTNPGDLVLDAFAGAGTTLAVAEKLGRRWTGVDSGALALHTAEKRLLGISGSRDPLNMKKKYSKECAPFVLLSDKSSAVQKDGSSNPEDVPAAGGCAITRDAGSGDYLLSFSGPIEELSMVLVDTSCDRGAFRVTSYISGARVANDGGTVRVRASDGGGVRVCAVDIHGVERFFYSPDAGRSGV